MARVGEPDLDPLAQVEEPAVLHRLQHMDGLLGVHQGVKRLHRRQSGALALLVVPVGVPLLDVGGVPEHDAHQLGGQAGGEDTAVEALLHQQGQAAGVVDVGVGNQNIVDVVGGEVQRVVVMLVLALLQAAVDKNFLAVDLQAVAAAGYRVGRSEKCQLHGIASLLIVWKGCLYCTPYLRKKLYPFVNLV